MDYKKRQYLLEKLNGDNTPFEEMKSALRIIGDKWSSLILICLFSGDSRFRDIQASLPSLNPRTLSKRLKVLEEAGLVTKQKFKEFPPRTIYTPTQKAYDLKEALAELHKWAKKYYPDC